MVTDAHSRNAGDEVRHYVKTCVPLMVPVPFLSTYRVHYGRGLGIGFPWVMRLVEDETCETVHQLHRAQDRIREILRNVPAPWEVESLYRPSDSTEVKFWVRVSNSQSPKGHVEYRCLYRPNPGDSVVANAQIRWLRPEEGGRLCPPVGPRYSTVARFEDQTEQQWKNEAWSLVIELQGKPDESGHQIATIRFLSENGPTKWLQTPSKFCLYEGEKKVAEAVVLGES